MRIGCKAVAALAAALLLASCGVTPPGATSSETLPGLATPSPAASSATPPASETPPATPSPTASETPVASATPTATPTATPAASPSKNPNAIVLSGTGIGKYKFGAAEKDVQRYLETALGKPDDAFLGPWCEIADDSEYSYSPYWEGFSVIYVAKDSSPDSPRTLAEWSFSLENGLPGELALPDDFPVGMSFAELKKKYPKAKIEDTGLGDDSYLMTLPNKLVLLGYGTPDTVQAGRFFLCD
jgi:hypothetical protein